MLGVDGVEIVDTVIDNGVDFRDVASEAVRLAVASKVERTGVEAELSYGHGGELDEPAGVGRVAMD